MIDPEMKSLVVRAMASVLVNSGVDLSNEIGCWRRLREAGFDRESVGEVFREVLRRARMKGGSR